MFPYQYIALAVLCAMAPKRAAPASIDVAAFLVDPFQYQNYTALNFTLGGGVPELSTLRAVQFWDNLANRTDVFPGVRFRVIYVWLPYPPTFWNAFIDQWCAASNLTSTGVPKFWIFPQTTYYMVDVGRVMEKYDAIGFSFGIYSTRALETNFPVNGTRRFPKHFSLSFSVEDVTEMITRTVVASGGRTIVHLMSEGDVYEESIAARMKATATQLNLTTVTFNSPNSVADAANISSIVQRLIPFDPDLVVIRQSFPAAVAFFDECRKNYYYPRALRVAPDLVPFPVWPSWVDRRFWIYESNSPALGRFQPQFDDFYFPISGGRSSLFWYQGNWTAFYNGTADVNTGPGFLVTSGMSVLHRSILATQTYNDTTRIAAYIQNNTFPTTYGRVSFGPLGEFLGIDRIVMQGPQPINKVVFPLAYREVNLTFPIPLGCPPPAPSPSATCDTQTLTWIQNGSLIIGGSGGSPSSPGVPAGVAPPVVISNPITVAGNVSIISVTLVLSEGNSSESGRAVGAGVVNATGCIDIQGGQLELPFSGANQVGQTTRILLISSSDCLTGKFDTILPIFESTSICLQVAASPTYTPRSLTVIFSVTDQCTSVPIGGGNVVGDPLPSWVIPVAVSAAAAVIVAMIIVICCIPSIRRRVAPGLDFGKKVKKLGAHAQ